MVSIGYCRSGILREPWRPRFGVAMWLMIGFPIDSFSALRWETPYGIVSLLAVVPSATRFFLRFAYKSASAAFVVSDST